MNVNHAFIAASRPTYAYGGEVVIGNYFSGGGRVPRLFKRPRLKRFARRAAAAREALDLYRWRRQNPFSGSAMLVMNSSFVGGSDV